MSLAGLFEPSVPYGSLVVISGANSFIGSHVVDQTLAAGFRVRALVQSFQEAAWMEPYFAKKYGSKRSFAFELYEVRDMTWSNAFDAAVEGASVFVHLAHQNFKTRISPIKSLHNRYGALHALESFSREPNAKRFVYTSSSIALRKKFNDNSFFDPDHFEPEATRIAMTLNQKPRFDLDNLDEDAIQRASQAGATRKDLDAASKVETELAIRK